MFYNNVMNKFSENLYKIRTEKNISRAQLAVDLNVSERLVGYWENGERECNFDMLIKLSNYFNVTTDILLGKTN